MREKTTYVQCNFIGHMLFLIFKMTLVRNAIDLKRKYAHVLLSSNLVFLNREKRPIRGKNAKISKSALQKQKNNRDQRGKYIEKSYVASSLWSFRVTLFCCLMLLTIPW